MPYPYLDSEVVWFSTEDSRWLIKQGKSVNELFTECIRACYRTEVNDGLLDIHLTRKTYQRARSILEAKGWFSFEAIFSQTASGQRKIIAYKAERIGGTWRYEKIDRNNPPEPPLLSSFHI